jgi:predicted anti-sigma-YlaC factor YlaD
MSNCKKYEDLIEQYLDGTITDNQLHELQKHAQTCDFCREEFEKSILLQKAVKDAFSSTLTAEQAGASVMAKLPEKESHQERITGVHPTWFFGKRIAVAAGVLLAIGLFMGFLLGRTNINNLLLTAKVPMQVAELKGTVLVRHQNSETWQTLTPETSVRIGDTFHSAAKSSFTLKLDAKSKIEVEQNSMLALTSYNGETQFSLEHGQCKASLESPHGPFFIDTPHGRVEALGTEFTVTVE